MNADVKNALLNLSSDSDWQKNLTALFTLSQSTVPSAVNISALPSTITSASFPLLWRGYIPGSGSTLAHWICRYDEVHTYSICSRRLARIPFGTTQSFLYISIRRPPLYPASYLICLPPFLRQAFPDSAISVFLFPELKQHFLVQVK